MEREPSISELNELFGAEGYEPFDIELEEDEQKNEGWVKINYLLNTKTQFTKENIKEELGIKLVTNQVPTFKLFMCNFYQYEDTIGFSFGNNPHPPKTWNPHQVTYSTIQGVIKKLEDKGLITFTKGNASEYKEKRLLSKASASKKLIKWILETIDNVYVDCDTHVRLRLAGNKNIILPYEPTTYTSKVDSIMKNYHKKLSQWGLQIDGITLDNLHLFVNYQAVKDQKDTKGNYVFRHGGRWYGPWNSIGSKERLKRISFKNTGALIEEDYQASCSNALSLWESGQWLDKDPYEFVGLGVLKNFNADGIENKMRDNIKKVINIAPNVGKGKLKAAVGGKFKKHKHQKLMVGLSERIITGFKFLNPHIAHWICRSELTGRKAMFIESNLVLGVIDRFCKADIPVVSIYDSFIFPKKYKQEALEIIYDTKGLDWLKQTLAKDEQGSIK